MSAIATKFITKYNLTGEMTVTDLSQYAPELLQLLTDDRKRDQAQRRFQEMLKLSRDQVCTLVPIQKSGQRKEKEINLITLDPVSESLEDKTISELAQRILQENQEKH